MLDFNRNRTIMRPNETAVDRFVDAWGEMGRVWGIPRTTARIHALLLAAAEPLSLDEITARLGVSKGGASDRLKELRSWDVVRRVSVAGDRRDFHEASEDVWAAFLAMVRARKAGEFDPAATAVRAQVGRLSRDAGKAVRARLRQVRDILDLLDGLGERLIDAGPATRTILGFLSGGHRRS
jgi:DNA-binding transcriptional regulator GbsR (MarR family)